MKHKFIDADALMEKFSPDSNGNRMPEVDVDNFPITETLADIKQIIHEMPAADVEPIKHGEWKYQYEEGHWRCSLCNYPAIHDALERCPGCHAKLERRMR